MNNFDRADFIFSLNFSQKWQMQGRKFVWIANWRKVEFGTS
jgi:hypothetical protein